MSSHGDCDREHDNRHSSGVSRDATSTAAAAVSPRDIGLRDAEYFRVLRVFLFLRSNVMQDRATVLDITVTAPSTHILQSQLAPFMIEHRQVLQRCPCSGRSQRVQVSVPERPRKRSSEEPGTDAGTYDREPLDSFASSEYGGQLIHAELVPSGGGGEPPYGWPDHGRSHGERWIDVLDRGQLIRKGNGISGSVEGDQAFSRRCINRGRRLATVGGVCGIVRIIRTG